ncbi:MAG TPA: papain-like cysteine protease family protein [Polyangiaceae bacterium]|nr:papain-like cysteine protease family protein [Polyangiaceae bacterium]
MHPGTTKFKFEASNMVWKLDFPAELGGQGALAFQPGLAVFPTNAGNNKKSIYAVTTDGRLAQIWDTDQWNVDFPVELAGQGGLRFQSGLAVFPTNAAANKKSIYAVTTDGRLAQVWDTNQWNLDFPAELAGQGGLRFQSVLAVFPTNAAANKKSIYAVTTDGRLAQVWDTNQWNLDFPAELAGQSGLRFSSRAAVFARNAAANKKSIFVVTTTGRLAQLWDTSQWNLDFPVEQSSSSGLQSELSPAAFATSVSRNLKSVYSVALGGRLFQVWDRPSVHLVFTMQAQTQSQWCWSAVATSTSLFYNAASTWTQCGLASAELGVAGCCGAPLPAGCNVPWYLDTALGRVGALASWQNGTISLNAIRSELLSGRVVGARIAWSGGGAHFVIIAGCDDDGILAIEDPAYGSSSIDIATFTSGYQGSGSWSHTYFTQ